MCSRRFWKVKNQPALVGRNMDWTTKLYSKLIVLPRGIKRTGLCEKNSAEWTSKYGSICVTSFDASTTDGMNEAGLGAHILYLSESDFGPRDESKPGVSLSLWAQYFLDNFATVAEAVEGAKRIQIRPVLMTHHNIAVVSPMHVAIEDESGDSCIFEYLNGELHIHHDPKYTTMTNSPPFEEQLELLKKFQQENKPIPGSPSAEDRFIRCYVFGNLLSDQPETYDMAVAGILSVMRNAATPWGWNDPIRPNVSPTVYQTVSDLTNKRYYFSLTYTPNLVWVDMKDLDLSEGAPAKIYLAQAQGDKSGNISEHFVDLDSFTFQGEGENVIMEKQTYVGPNAYVEAK